MDGNGSENDPRAQAALQDLLGQILGSAAQQKQAQGQQQGPDAMDVDDAKDADGPVYAVVDGNGRTLFASRDPNEAKAFEARARAGLPLGPPSGAADMSSILPGLVGGIPRNARNNEAGFGRGDGMPFRPEGDDMRRSAGNPHARTPVVLIDERGRPIVVDPAAAAAYGSGLPRGRAADDANATGDATEADIGDLLRALGAKKAHAVRHGDGGDEDQESPSLVFVDEQGRPIAVRPGPKRRGLDVRNRLPELGNPQESGPLPQPQLTMPHSMSHGMSRAIPRAMVDGVHPDHDEQLRRLLAHAFAANGNEGAAPHTRNATVEGVPDHLPLFTVNERGEPVLVRPPSQRRVEPTHATAAHLPMHAPLHPQPQGFVMLDENGRPVLVGPPLARDRDVGRFPDGADMGDADGGVSERARGGSVREDGSAYSGIPMDWDGTTPLVLRDASGRTLVIPPQRQRSDPTISERPFAPSSTPVYSGSAAETPISGTRSANTSTGRLQPLKTGIEGVAPGDMGMPTAGPMETINTDDARTFRHDTPSGRAALGTAAPAPFGPHAETDAFVRNQALGSLMLWKRPLVEIDARAHVDTALDRLEANNIIAMPVYDSTAKCYTGLITTLDLMIYLAGRMFDPNGKLLSVAERRDLAQVPISSLIGTSDYFGGRGKWRKNGLLVFEPTATVGDILGPMASGVQRVLVRTHPTDGDEGDNDGIHEGKAVGHRIISQGDIVKHLAEHNIFFPSTFGAKLTQLGLHVPKDGREVVCISPDTPTLAAYRKLFEEDVDALAVVDGDGRIVATLSPSDLRGLRVKSAGDLLRPVGDYLMRQHHGRLPAAVAVRAEATLLSAAVSALAASVHRVWVVDASGKPVSMVRMQDVINCVHATMHRQGPVRMEE